MSHGFTESVVEDAALEWLHGLGYSVLSGPDIAPDTPSTERSDYSQVILEGRLRRALAGLNPALPVEALDDAFRRLTHIDGPTPVERNHAFHKMLVDGVTVEYKRPDGSIAGAQAQVIDFDNPDSNDWLAVNQFTVAQERNNRRPDIVIFINGLPLAVIELKNAADEKATIWSAFKQLQTYKAEISSLFDFNEVLIISDGVQARAGSLTAGHEWFKPWRTIAGEELADTRLPQLQVIIEGLLDRRRFLDLIRYFIVHEETVAGALVKKMAGYHQFHAVGAAVEETLRASLMAGGASLAAEPGSAYEVQAEPPGERAAKTKTGGAPGDRRIGVVWHTQGSGKSLTMAFYAGRIISAPEMENPTLVMLTDRNDLDNQLFGTFL